MPLGQALLYADFSALGASKRLSFLMLNPHGQSTSKWRLCPENASAIFQRWHRQFAYDQLHPQKSIKAGLGGACILHEVT